MDGFPIESSLWIFKLRLPFLLLSSVFIDFQLKKKVNFFLQREFVSVNFFLWREFLPVQEISLYEISSSTGYYLQYRKLLPEINAYLHEKRLAVTQNFPQYPGIGNFLLWQEISSCDKKYLHMTRNFFLWQEISSCDKKFLPVTRNFFMLQEIS